MADISAYLSQIRNASRGETVRDAITSAVKQMITQGISAEYIVGENGTKTSKDDYVTKTQAQTALLTGKLKTYTKLYDSTLNSKSDKAITAKTAFSIWNQINSKLITLLGEDE